MYINLKPKSRKGEEKMKKYIVQYLYTTANLQPYLRSLTKNVAKAVYQFETTDLEEAIKIVNKEIEVSDLPRIEDVDYDISDKEFNNYGTWIEILEFDDEGELIGKVDFKSPTYWLENEI